jgi:tRNA A37 threonylcarbamoyladenosine dehydratase
MSAFDPDRYSRQTRFAPLGLEGQARLAAGRVAIVGCGALGSVVAMATSSISGLFASQLLYCTVIFRNMLRS